MITVIRVVLRIAFLGKTKYANNIERELTQHVI